MGSRSRTLLNSRFDHESCGVGFVATLHGASSHDILRLTLTALARLAHRGAVAADRKSSDGVGVLTAVPRRFLLDQTAIALPAEQPLAVGMLFLPPEGVTSRDALRFEECISAQGLRWLAWREVPIRREVLGELALDSLPVIRQALITVPDSVRWTESEVEHRLYLARKAFERQSAGQLCLLALHADPGLQGDVRGPTAARVLSRPARYELRYPVRDLPSAIRNQRAALVASRAATAHVGAQRRDQHHLGQSRPHGSPARNACRANASPYSPAMPPIR